MPKVAAHPNDKPVKQKSAVKVEKAEKKADKKADKKAEEKVDGVPPKVVSKKLAKAAKADKADKANKADKPIKKKKLKKTEPTEEEEGGSKYAEDAQESQVDALRAEIDGAVDSEEDEAREGNEEEVPSTSFENEPVVMRPYGAPKKQKKAVKKLKGPRKSFEQLKVMAREVRTNSNKCWARVPKLLAESTANRPSSSEGSSARRNREQNKPVRNVKLISRHAVKIAAHGAVNYAGAVLRREAGALNVAKRYESSGAPWNPIVTKGAVAALELFLSSYAQLGTYNAQMVLDGTPKYKKLHEKHMEMGFDRAALMHSQGINGMMTPYSTSAADDDAYNRKQKSKGGKKRAADGDAAASEKRAKNNAEEASEAEEAEEEVASDA